MSLIESSEFTETQIKAINNLRARVSDISESAYEESEAYLSRWLDQTKFEPGAAERALRAHKQWRLDYQVEGILDEDFSDLEKRFPLIPSGEDRTGCPVFISRAGHWEIKPFLAEGGPSAPARFLRFTVQLFERFAKLLREREAETHGQVTGVILIYDMSGFSFRRQVSSAVISLTLQLAQLLEANYPNMGRKMYILNVSKAWKVLFRLFKPFLGEKTLERLRVFDCNKDEWQACLFQDVEPKQLPEYLGGTKGH